MVLNYRKHYPNTHLIFEYSIAALPDTVEILHHYIRAVYISALRSVTSGWVARRQFISERKHVALYM